jgi:hypothetical protein
VPISAFERGVVVIFCYCGDGRRALIFVIRIVGILSSRGIINRDGSRNLVCASFGRAI